MKYAVEQKYYVSGHVEATLKEVSNDTKDCNKEFSAYDLYLDVFDTKEEAIEWLQEAREA